MTPLLECESIGFLGPAGTFTEEALDLCPHLRCAKKVAFPTVPETILATQAGETDLCFVPIENSIEGSVNATLDTLAFDTELRIQMELVMPIRHLLLAKPGTRLEEIRILASHPQATAQCREHLQQLVPGATVMAANSTAEAARSVAAAAGEMAAVGNRLAAELYGLEVLKAGIEDHETNMTRFVVLGRDMQAPSGADKSSLVLFIHKDQPGSLLQILQEFAYRYINLTKIESRPTKRSLGDYCFFLDCEGHVAEEPLVSALKCLNCKLRQVKVLGSYSTCEVKEGSDA
ncbi:MAG: prephenate dehydratase [Candidatus Geothermincolia bacterium]